MFFTFRTHLIHWPFVSNATSCTTQQLLLHYQMSSVPYGRLLFAQDITITSALDCMSRTNQSSSSHRCLYRHQLASLLVELRFVTTNRLVVSVKQTRYIQFIWHTIKLSAVGTEAGWSFMTFFNSLNNRCILLTMGPMAHKQFSFVTLDSV